MALDPPEPLRTRFARLALAHGPAIGRAARAYARSAAEREDLEQDIALALWRALPGFRGDCAERTFVLRIAHNQAITFAARRRVRLAPTDLADEALAAGPDPEVLAGLSQRMRAVFQAIHALPFGQRQVLVLALEGLGHEEIGEVLGISANNVAVRANRARAGLRRAIGEGS